MKNEEFFKKIGKIDDDLITEADKQISLTAKKRPMWVKLAAAAACMALVAGLGTPAIVGQINRIDLATSNGVRAKYIDKAPLAAQMAMDLMSLTEEELFTEFNTAVFKGEVVEIKNIVLNFNGEKEYRSIASIRLDKVYKGDCSQGEIVEVLLPCPIDDGVWVEDTETVSAMRVGVTGIFMPMIYDEESYFEMNAARLNLVDLAPLGFADGVRFAFLETDDEIVFARWAYPSLENAQTLDDVEQFVIKMIEETK